MVIPHCLCSLFRGLNNRWQRGLFCQRAIKPATMTIVHTQHHNYLTSPTGYWIGIKDNDPWEKNIFVCLFVSLLSHSCKNFNKKNRRMLIYLSNRYPSYQCCSCNVVQCSRIDELVALLIIWLKHYLYGYLTSVNCGIFRFVIKKWNLWSMLYWYVLLCTPLIPGHVTSMAVGYCAIELILWWKCMHINTLPST